MKHRITYAAWMLAVVTGATISHNACTGGFKSVDLASLNESFSSDDFQMAVEGKVLYENNCASCHSPLDQSLKRDRNAMAITNAINTIPTMSFLKSKLSSGDIDRIAAALSTSELCDPGSLAKTTVRRMNFREFFNSTTDLFGTHSLAVSDYPPDTRGDIGFDNEGTGIRTLGADTGKIVAAAEKVADQILANAGSRFNSCNSSTDKSTCVKNLLTPVVRKAFRVPVTSDEILPFINFVMAAPTTQEGMKNAMVAMMVSPRFLFHVVDYTANRSGMMHTLSAHELAARLALFLWSSIPDETLASLADSGQILQLEVQKQQVDRMLKDPRAQSFVKSFPSQWLGYHSVASATRSSSMHPEFTPALKSSMVREADLMFADIINRRLPADTVVGANYTFVDQTLAQFYGLPYPAGATGFQSVMLDGNNRRGLLTQAAIMTSTSFNDYTHPIHRGVVFLARVMCTPVGTPPAGIPSLSEVDPNMPIKDRLAAHRTDMTCASCHQHIDPVGLAFENFSSTGKWRETDGRYPVDASGTTADGYSFNKPGELTAWIARGEKFESCMNEYLGAYALGRALSQGEKCYTRKVVKDKAATNGTAMTDMIEGIVTSEFFRKSLVKE